MTVYSRGYYSGYDAVFYCRDGSICDLICDGNGCNGMQYVCLHGSTCTLSCDEDNGIDCPKQSISTSSDDDISILEYISDIKNQRNHDKQYVEIST